MRIGNVHRRTGETDIEVQVELDGAGRADVHTGVPFFDHMLQLFAHHGVFNLTVAAQGDLQVDAHHTVEDVGICLGAAIAEALGDRARIVRTGHSYVPMDEALALVALDLSARPYAVIDVQWQHGRLGEMDADLVRHFFESVAFAGRFNLHARVLYGSNDHHKAEALFKAFARALATACTVDPRRPQAPSTKGLEA